MINKHHRFVFLDGLRGIAALSVVIFHFTDLYGHRPLLSSAPLAVDLFFCLSGFVIAWSYYQKLVDGMSYGEYIKRRLIRLYPMFAVGLLVGFIGFLTKLHAGTSNYSTVEILKSNLLNIFYLPYFVNTQPGEIHGLFLTNPPSWSLFFELVANLAFIFTVRLPKALLIAMTGILGAWLIYEGLYFDDWPGWSTVNFIGGFPRVGYSFMLGVLIYKYFDLSKNVPRLNPYLVSSILAFAFLLPFHRSIPYWLICAVILVPALVIVGARVEIADIRSMRLFEYLGWISYPLYCLHSPMLNIWKGISPKPAHFHIEVAILFICTVFVTHVVAKYIDDPVRAWLGKKLAHDRV